MEVAGDRYLGGLVGGEQLRFARKEGANLRSENVAMALMVLSVEHIFASGLESVVLPPNTAAIAAIVAGC